MWHFSRYRMYQRLATFFESPRRGRVLAISGAGPIGQMFAGDARITETAYPDVDVMALPYDEAEFDYVVADQVIEHVPQPFVAVDEMRRVLRPGGHAMITTCLLNPVHEFPADYWRFTPAALRELCHAFSDIEQCEGWGNARALFLILYRRMRFAPVRPGTPLERIATHNDGVHLIHTWIIARK